MKLSQDFNLQQVYNICCPEFLRNAITVYDVRRREESYITLVLGLITLHLKKQTRMNTGAVYMEIRILPCTYPLHVYRGVSSKFKVHSLHCPSG